LKVINTDPSPPSGDFSVRMQVCTPLPASSQVPPPSKSGLKSGEEVSIKFSELKRFGVSVLPSSASNTCKTNSQPPTNQPADTGQT